MSMPKFPEIDPEITCNHALNMILASIAMEELALSHIMNAEGEKLQYVLGTLETSTGENRSTEEILAVNQSITCLLESVAQNQMILKNKMDKAIHALSEICPEHPCPPKPDCHKCSAAFKTTEKCHIWHAGSALPWSKEAPHGECVSISACDKSKIEVQTKGRFVISFAMNARAKNDCKKNAAIRLQMMQHHKEIDLYTVHSHVYADTTVTILMGGIIVEISDHPVSLLLKLLSPDTLMVKNAMISIIEL